MKVWKKIRSGEEVEYRQKSHLKTFLLPGKVNWPLNNIFKLKKNLIFGSKMIPNWSQVKKRHKMFFCLFIHGITHIYLIVTTIFYYFEEKEGRIFFDFLL